MKGFTQLLADLDHGRALDKYSEELAGLISQVLSTHRKGSMTLTLDFNPLNDSQLEVSDKLVVKPPTTQGSYVMYATPSGALVTRDPRQPELPLTAVEKPQTEEEDAASNG